MILTAVVKGKPSKVLFEALLDDGAWNLYTWVDFGFVLSDLIEEDQNYFKSLLLLGYDKVKVVRKPKDYHSYQEDFEEVKKVVKENEIIIQFPPFTNNVVSYKTYHVFILLSVA